MSNMRFLNRTFYVLFLSFYGAARERKNKQRKWKKAQKPPKNVFKVVIQK